MHRHEKEWNNVYLHKGASFTVLIYNIEKYIYNGDDIGGRDEPMGDDLYRKAMRFRAQFKSPFFTTKTLKISHFEKKCLSKKLLKTSIFNESFLEFSVVHE